MDKILIGVGNTAEVFEWEDNKVLKLFYKGYPEFAVEKEYLNALAVKDLDFPKPIAYEVLKYEGRSGIVYEKVSGESLEDWFYKFGDLDKCAFHMSLLHKKMLKFEVEKLPDYKEFLEYNIQNAKSCKTSDKEAALEILHKLPEGKTLCHGDFHPGNILISGTEACVIDFMNLCRGDYLYDIARTVYLVEFTPVPESTEDKEALKKVKTTLANMYLSYMGIERESITDYLQLIKVARAGECPEE